MSVINEVLKDLWRGNNRPGEIAWLLIWMVLIMFVIIGVAGSLFWGWFVIGNMAEVVCFCG